jgi:hypothetical protein
MSLSCHGHVQLKYYALLSLVQLIIMKKNIYLQKDGKLFDLPL